VLIVDEACGIGACFFFLNNDAIPATAATPAKIGNNAPPVAATGAKAAEPPDVRAVDAAAFLPPILINYQLYLLINPLLLLPSFLSPPANKARTP
jgi:hypothetical protein